MLNRDIKADNDDSNHSAELYFATTTTTTFFLGARACVSLSPVRSLFYRACDRALDAQARVLRLSASIYAINVPRQPHE